MGYMVRILISERDKSFHHLELIPYRQSVEIGGIQLLIGDEKNYF